MSQSACTKNVNATLTAIPFSCFQYDFDMLSVLAWILQTKADKLTMARPWQIAETAQQTSSADRLTSHRSAPNRILSFVIPKCSRAMRPSYTIRRDQQTPLDLGFLCLQLLDVPTTPHELATELLAAKPYGKVSRKLSRIHRRLWPSLAFGRLGRHLGLHCLVVSRVPAKRNEERARPPNARMHAYNVQVGSLSA